MMLLRASFAARILAILLAIYGVLSFSISASGGPGKALQSTSLRMADDDFPDAIMYEMPVSNAGARCRYIIYEKGLDDGTIQIEAPSAIGGLKSKEYLEIHPMGKMPALVTETGEAIPESDTVCTCFLHLQASLRIPLRLGA
ncbi:unnamed protein product [Heterosigma akashiwo]